MHTGPKSALLDVYREEAFRWGDEEESVDDFLDSIYEDAASKSKFLVTSEMVVDIVYRNCSRRTCRILGTKIERLFAPFFEDLLLMQMRSVGSLLNCKCILYHHIQFLMNRICSERLHPEPIVNDSAHDVPEWNNGSGQ